MNVDEESEDTDKSYPLDGSERLRRVAVRALRGDGHAISYTSTPLL